MPPIPPPHRPRAELVELLQARRGKVAPRPARGRVPEFVQPDSVRLAYYRELRALLELARDAVQGDLLALVPELLPAEVRADAESANVAAAKKRVQRAIDQAERKVADSVRPAELEQLARRMGQRTAGAQKQTFVRTMQRALGVNLADVARVDVGIERQIEGWAALNVDLIKTLPKTYFDDLRLKVIDAAGSGMRHETLATEIADRYQVALSRAQLIARDQVGKLYGQVNAQRQQNLGMVRYTWQTSRDNRVREEHEARQGEVFSWADPPEDGHPGEAINCRCYAEPDVEGLLESLTAGP